MDDDRELVAAAVAGSGQAGEELFARHWPAAWRLALSATGSTAAADDVAQDAFERAFRRLPAFDGRSSFRTWLSRIVVNRAIDLARRHRPSQRLDSVAAQPGTWSDDDSLRDRELFEAVAALPADRRTVVARRYWTQHTPAEIAEILDLPIGTVHSRLARSLADLRSRLEVSGVHRT